MQAAAQGFKERKGNKAQSACETFLFALWGGCADVQA
jgi:hypothetical protein